MSFRCEICDKAQPTGHAPIQVVTKTRDAHYPDTSKIGTETVQEKNCCEPCAVTIQVALDEAAAKALEEQAKALEAQNRNFEEQAYGDRPSEWRDGVTAAP